MSGIKCLWENLQSSNKSEKHCTLDACCFHAMCVCVCVCVFTAKCAVLLYSFVMFFTKSHYKTIFNLTHNRIWAQVHEILVGKQCCEIVNVIVIVLVTWSDKLNLSTSTTSDFKVQMKSSKFVTIGLNGNGRFNASACPLPRQHHWWITKLPYPVCSCTSSAEKGT